MAKESTRSPEFTYYALPDAILTDGSHHRILRECFGFGKGRLIKRPDPLPSGSRSLPDLLKRIGAPKGFNPEQVLPLREVPPEKEDEAWDDNKVCLVHRTPVGIADALMPILDYASAIYIYDPYVNTIRGIRFLTYLLKALKGRKALSSSAPEIEIHCTTCRGGICGKTAYSQIQEVVPDWNLTVVEWKLGHFHNRFVIVDNGGVGLAWGLGVDDAQDNHDVLFLLTKTQTTELVEKLAPGSWPKRVFGAKA